MVPPRAHLSRTVPCPGRRRSPVVIPSRRSRVPTMALVGYLAACGAGEDRVEEIEELDPACRDVPVGELLREMTLPALDALENAVAREDRDGFVRGHDERTRAWNACRVASERGALVIQRPTALPLTNVRFRP